MNYGFKNYFCHSSLGGASVAFFSPESEASTSFRIGAGILLVIIAIAIKFIDVKSKENESAVIILFHSWV